MNCKKCGQPLAENAKFCPNCGTRVEQQQSGAFCSTCGAKLDSSVQFCPVCGVKVGQAERQTVNNSVTASGKLLTSQKLISKYKGTPIMGFAEGIGTLFVYDDRIEFKKIGSSLGAVFGSADIAAAQSKMAKDPVDIYPVSQIVQLYIGKYLGVYNTLVVQMRDGTTVSFCPAVPGSTEPQNIMNSLQPYRR